MSAITKYSGAVSPPGSSPRMSSLYRRTRYAFPAVLVCLITAGCAGSSPSRPAEESATPVSAEATRDTVADEPELTQAQRQALLDRSQQVVAAVVNNTALWFDGLFATAELENRTATTTGRLALGSRWDERDGLKKRVRFAARVPLPELQRRVRLVLGRSDTDDLLDGSESNELKTVPDEFNDTEDEDWFLGLGYRPAGNLASGFDTGVGVTFAAGGLRPYAQAHYKLNRVFGEDWLLRVRPRVFWRDDRGGGVSLSTILDYSVSRNWLLRSWAVLVDERDTDGVRWTGKLLAYQSLSGRSAFSYNVFATGDTKREVEVDDYGFEVRYRRRVFREWLFLELSTGVSWPRQLLVEPRESNFAVGAELEMHFGGDW